MSVQGLNHFNVRSRDLQATEEFYCNLLGFKVGPRPPFAGDGLWLYIGDDPILHVGLRESQSAEEGPIDHVALTATDLPGTYAKLYAAHAEGLRLTRVPEGGPRGGLWQIFCQDPTGSVIELDFDKSEPAPAGYAA